MSRELNSVIGKQEILIDVRNQEVDYIEQILSISSFYGGKERGKCLQLSLDDTHIQLPRDKVILLRNTLIEWLDE